MTPDQVMAALTPVQRVGLTAWAEGRARYDHGQWVPNPQQAMADIVNVIDNRAKDPRWRRLGHGGVCYYPWAFSCWTPFGGDANFEALIGTARLLLEEKDAGPIVSDCLALAALALDGRFKDELDRSCHYIADWMKAWPRWTVGHKPVVRRHGHLFFNDIR
jgi:hypothetical protein